MKKMVIMLMMVMMSFVSVSAQMVVGSDYDNVYVSYDGGMTSQRVSRSQLPYGNMIGKGNLQEQIMYYGQRAAEEEYARTGNRMVYQQRMAQLGMGGIVYTGVYGGYGVTPVTEDNMLATMGSGIYVNGKIGDVYVGGDPGMAVARVINFGKGLFKKNNTTTTTTTPATTATRYTTTRTTTPTTTTTRTNTTKVNPNVTYNVSTGKFESVESLVSGF
jgi:hypothetical protein